MLDLGARGVQLGTRFIATEECDADARFKQAYVACRKEDIVIIQSPVGLPGRAIRSAFLEDVARGVRKVFRCPSHCLQSCGAKDARYCIAEALDHARRGEFEDGFAFCGANALRVRTVVPVADLVSGLRQEFALACFIASIKVEYEKAAEMMRSLRAEYSLALGRVRERFRENRAGLRVEKARFRAHLVRLRSDYLKAKAERRALEARLRLLRDQACSLEA